MALAYLLSPTFQIENTAGKPATGGYIEVYIAGSRTKYYCASDFDGTLHPFRIPLDSLGSNIVLADDSGSYDVYVYNRYGGEMMSRYNVKPGSGGGIGSITSADGSIIITPTENGLDLRTNSKAPSILRAIAQNLSVDGQFQFSELQRDGQDAVVDTNGRVMVNEGWWHYDATVRLRWPGDPNVNGTQSISLYTANASDSTSFDLSYAHSDTIQVNGEFKAESDGTQFILGVTGVQPGMTVELVDYGIHSIIGEGAGGKYNAGTGIDIDEPNRVISVDFDEVQEKLTAGTGITIDNEGVISVDESAVQEIFPVTYDSTTFQEIRTALIAGKLPVMFRNNGADFALQVQRIPLHTFFNVGGSPGSSYAQFWSPYVYTSSSPSLPPYALFAVYSASYDFETHTTTWSTSYKYISEQSDWAESDATKLTFVKNKPDLSVYATQTDLTNGLATKQDVISDLSDIRAGAAAGATAVQDANYVHTDNNFTNSDVTKLSGIEAGAQANVQADWNQTDTSADDYIKNKPTIPPSSVVDQTYNPSSTNAQSGTAVAGAISGVNQVPSSTSGDSGKVLTVDSQGNPEWADVQAPISAGTGIDITNDTVSVDFTEVQAKLEAGANISITGNVISAIVPEYANADWDATSGEPGYIANKPENLVQDADYVHTDNNFSDSDKSKLDSIEAGAQANVNSDWDAASGEPGFIENKPDLSQYATQTDLADKQDVLTAGDNITIVNNVISATAAPQLNADWDATSGVQEILHKPDLSQYATQTDLSGKQDVLTAGANITIVNDVISAASSTQLNADWDATSGVQEILNKPTIPPLKELVAGTGITITDGDESVTISADAGQQVNADWDATSGVAEILNKPVLAAVATTGAYSDLSGKPTIPTATSDLTNDSGFITLSDVPAQVQPDWDATSGLGEILNKPVLATVATTGAYSDLSGTPAIPTATSDLTNDSGFITLSDVPAQVQPDWNATSGLGEILNKPSIPVIGTITV